MNLITIASHEGPKTGIRHHTNNQATPLAETSRAVVDFGSLSIGAMLTLYLHPRLAALFLVTIASQRCSSLYSILSHHLDFDRSMYVCSVLYGLSRACFVIYLHVLEPNLMNYSFFASVCRKIGDWVGGRRATTTPAWPAAASTTKSSEALWCAIRMFL